MTKTRPLIASLVTAGDISSGCRIYTILYIYHIYSNRLLVVNTLSDLQPYSTICTSPGNRLSLGRDFVFIDKDDRLQCWLLSQVPICHHCLTISPYCIEVPRESPSRTQSWDPVRRNDFVTPSFKFGWCVVEELVSPRTSTIASTGHAS